MTSYAPQFTPIASNKSSLTLPERFTFPYYYQPHPLCLQVIDELQHDLLNDENGLNDVTKKGRMFGVLLVQDEGGNLGYLSSFAGQLPYHSERFVPEISVHEAQLNEQFEQQIINIKNELHTLEGTTRLRQISDKLNQAHQQSLVDIQVYQTLMTGNKQQRQNSKAKAELELAPDAFSLLVKKLGEQSSQEKRKLKSIKQQWKKTISELEEEQIEKTNILQNQKKVLLEKRHALIRTRLQQISFLNQYGKKRSLYQLFEHDKSQWPIAGSEHENAPKLLQYAFKHKMKPLALAEFWWGSSPQKEVRQHKNLYPVCQSKCFEILNHMLTDIETDPSPLTINPAEGKSLEIIYEDDVMIVVNKPAEFLSVPGKSISDSVYTRIKQRYPKASGPLIVHRLDMSTSGLIVLTLNSEANRQIQKQFIERTVTKHYVALLEGELNENHGQIELPLAGDLSDRPRQLVCFESGKKAETKWQVLERNNGRTKVRLSPKTGRTHQLRVHCAHHLGLNCSIVGDDLYGYKQNRLHLHAEYLRLIHPVTQQVMEFKVNAEF